ncbi:hypothetical protein D3C75_259670 [compost metagenome]
MPDRRFYGADAAELLLVRKAAERPCHAFNLNRISQRCGCAMCLDIGYRLRMNAGPHKRFADHLSLPLWPGCSNSLGTPVIVDRRALDYRVDMIAVPQCGMKRLQEHSACPFPQNHSVRPLVKRIALACWRQRGYPAQRHERRWAKVQIHPSGKRHLRLSGPQTLAGHMDGHQGRGAGGIHDQTRPAQVEAMADPRSHFIQAVPCNNIGDQP